MGGCGQLSTWQQAREERPEPEGKSFLGPHLVPTSLRKNLPSNGDDHCRDVIEQCTAHMFGDMMMSTSENLLNSGLYKRIDVYGI